MQYAHWGDCDGSVTIHRTGYYSVDYQLTKLEEIAAKTRLMPDHFINKAGNGVTDAFAGYLRPLLGDNLFEASRLRAPQAAKILKL